MDAAHNRCFPPLHHGPLGVDAFCDPTHIRGVADEPIMRIRIHMYS